VPHVVVQAFNKELVMKDIESIKGSLLLSRKDGENIILEVNGEKIIVNLHKTGNGRAKIRIHASANVQIQREEVYKKETYKKENYLFTLKKV
jgi:sRNA-binding carbon storage regulator CsrA